MLTYNPLFSTPCGLSKLARTIGTDQLGKFLYAVNDSDIVHYRHIEIGQLINDTLRQVLGGLSPQERYVTEALMKVRDGMKIKPIP